MAFLLIPANPKRSKRGQAKVAYADAVKVEVMSFPYEEGGKVYVMARRTPGDPTTLERMETRDLRSMFVECPRDGARFYATPRPYPTGQGNVQSAHYDINGDISVTCPLCARSYFHYSEGEDLADLGETGKTGWHADRPLTVIEDLR